MDEIISEYTRGELIQKVLNMIIESNDLVLAEVASMLTELRVTVNEHGNFIVRE